MDCVLYLIKHIHALEDVDSVDDTGRTPLHSAVIVFGIGALVNETELDQMKHRVTKLLGAGASPRIPQQNDYKTILRLNNGNFF